MYIPVEARAKTRKPTTNSSRTMSGTPDSTRTSCPSQTPTDAVTNMPSATGKPGVTAAKNSASQVSGAAVGVARVARSMVPGTIRPTVMTAGPRARRTPGRAMSRGANRDQPTAMAAMASGTVTAIARSNPCPSRSRALPMSARVAITVRVTAAQRNSARARSRIHSVRARRAAMRGARRAPATPWTLVRTRSGRAAVVMGGGWRCGVVPHSDPTGLRGPRASGDAREPRTSSAILRRNIQTAYSLCIPTDPRSR